LRAEGIGSVWFPVVMNMTLERSTGTFR